ncbi:MAG: entericidin A/B family lipoprotein [Burkholderiaceae bacterium]
MRAFLALLFTSCALMLAGCNTIAGMGKDVESGGAAVEGAAKDVQKKM